MKLKSFLNNLHFFSFQNDLSMEFSVAVHKVCNRKNKRSKTAEIENIQTLLLNHVESKLTKLSQYLKKGVMPSRNTYLNIIVTACLSKQNERSSKTKDCYAYAYDLMNPRNDKVKQFKLNGFLKANAENSTMENLVQRKVSKKNYIQYLFFFVRTKNNDFEEFSPN
jgi:hypothetical protein